MQIKNIEALHPSVRSDVEEFARRLSGRLGDNLNAISAYGSVTGPDFVPGKSDVNLIAVLNAISRENLAALFDAVKWGRKRRIVPPLLLTPDYIKASRDVFPIEFMDIKRSQAVLYGDDHFSFLELDPAHVRLECETQLKGALLRTRQAYLEIGMDKKGAEEVLHAAVNSLLPVFRAMLTLKECEAPGPKTEVVERLGETFGLDMQPVRAVLMDKAGDEKIGGEEAHLVLGGFISVVTGLAGLVDRL
jgi:hypothetical protein